MSRWTLALGVVVALSFAPPGCLSTRDAPLIPPQTEGSDIRAAGHGSAADPVLWGYYDVFPDAEGQGMLAVCDRTGMFAVNVVTILNGKPSSLSFQIVEIRSEPQYTDVDINVTLTHPFPGMPQYNGYDVRGVFIGNGSLVLAHNSSLVCAKWNVDQYMLDDPDDGDGGGPDGYTRWFNPSEFGTPGLFGYTKGNASSSGYTGTATLNPYRLFANGLGSHGSAFDFVANKSGSGNNVFSAGAKNTRNYYIRFPMPFPAVRFNYAVIASWKGELSADHPANAPEAVAAKLSSQASTAYFVSDSIRGGSLVLDFSLAGYGAQPDQIFVESPVLSHVHGFVPGSIADGTGGGTFSGYHVEIVADNIKKSGAQDVWVIARYSEYDYTNEYGVGNNAGAEPLEAYFRSQVQVLDYVPAWIKVLSPNGGEEWDPGSTQTIQWESYLVSGPVKIEYSKDNFASDIHVLASSTANTGSWVWTSVPYDPSNTVKVRITSLENPNVQDKSDNCFTITQPAITVLLPNGGEQWSFGGSKEITWSSSHLLGTVSIEYSKDKFGADVHLIGSGENNDGSFIWSGIPCDITDSARVRIKSELFPQVSDTSDENFSILGGGFAESWGTTARDEGWDVVTRGDYVYVTGLTGVSSGNYDVFVAKFGPCDETVWALGWGGMGYDYGSRVAVDSSDNVYVIGAFSGTVDFDPGPGTAYRTAQAYYDVFLTKLNSNGAFQWVSTWGGSGTDGAYGIVLDSSGNIYVGGDFQFTADFDPGPLVNPRVSNGGYDAYINKFNPSGGHVWVRVWGGTGDDFNYGMSINSSNEMFASGAFSSVVDFDPGAGIDNRASNGLSDAYVSKFNADGTRLWTVTWGGSGNDGCHSNTVNKSGNLLVTGYFSSVVDLDPGSGSLMVTSAGYTDAFVSAFSSAGSLLWGKAWGGIGFDLGYGVTACSSGNTFVSGEFELLADFDPGPNAEFRLSKGLKDAYLLKLDPDGDLVWVRTWGGTSDDSSFASAVNRFGSSYVIGYFTGTVEFAPVDPPCSEASDMQTAVGLRDVFLCRYLSGGCW